MIKIVQQSINNESPPLTQQEKMIAAYGYRPMPLFLSRKKLVTTEEKSIALNQKIQSLL